MRETTTNTANKSILNFFTKKGTVTSSKPKKVVADASSISVAFNSGLSEAKDALVVEEIVNATGAGKPMKRTVYSQKDKLMIARYGNTHGPARAIAKFVKEFTKLTDSTARAWIPKYRKELSANNKNNEEILITIGQKRGRPLSLPVELDTMLRKFIMSLRNAGGNINHYVVHGVLMGLIKLNMTKYIWFMFGFQCIGCMDQLSLQTYKYVSKNGYHIQTKDHTFNLGGNWLCIFTGDCTRC